MLRATATSNLKGIVTLTAIQSSDFGPPASRDVCVVTAFFPFSIGLYNVRARARMVPLRLLLHELVQARNGDVVQNSREVGSKIWTCGENCARKPSENSPAICEARCNWNSRVSVFHRQKCERGPTGKCDINLSMRNTLLLTLFYRYLFSFTICHAPLIFFEYL